MDPELKARRAKERQELREELARKKIQQEEQEQAEQQAKKTKAAASHQKARSEVGDRKSSYHPEPKPRTAGTSAGSRPSSNRSSDADARKQLSSSREPSDRGNRSASRATPTVSSRERNSPEPPAAVEVQRGPMVLLRQWRMRPSAKRFKEERSAKRREFAAQKKRLDKVAYLDEALGISTGPNPAVDALISSAGCKSTKRTVTKKHSYMYATEKELAEHTTIMHPGGDPMAQMMADAQAQFYNSMKEAMKEPDYPLPGASAMCDACGQAGIYNFHHCLGCGDGEDVCYDLCPKCSADGTTVAAHTAEHGDHKFKEILLKDEVREPRPMFKEKEDGMDPELKARRAQERQEAREELVRKKAQDEEQELKNTQLRARERAQARAHKAKQ